ncbi:MAG: RNA methyltransferase, partial [Bdellovibrionales bacterium]|nr:RNA methyltransferase [Bdellovibrionales bacterium]
MPRFLAVTSKGLGGAVFEELREQNFKALSSSSSSATFECSWEEVYRAHLVLRSATRILLPVLDFHAYQYDDIYHHILKKHDFTKYISVDQTVAVDAQVTSEKLKDQRLIAMKVKDAVVDQFREKFGKRPSVERV